MLSRRQFEQAGRSEEHLIFFLRHPIQATMSFFFSLPCFFSLSACDFFGVLESFFDLEGLAAVREGGTERPTVSG
jgi:hypothetical protein